MKSTQNNNENWESQFYKSILNTALKQYLKDFASIIDDWDSSVSVKELKRWQQQISNLPEIEEPELIIGDTIRLTSKHPLSSGIIHKTKAVLKNFMPWRKGPFDFFDVFIDTEWRSDLKWQRVLPHIPNLIDKSVLDVGCGSGYHLFRMHEAGARQVIGIDPTALFFFQFQCIKQYFSNLNIHFIPCTMEQLPSTQYFDCVFSMGVLYHRPDPIKFLKELKQQLTKGGTLILETLVVEGDQTTVLVPEQRYAQMRNVWFIPSVAALTLWLKKVGFKNIKCVDIDQTSTAEQRATEWIDSQSLSDFLDPTDHTLTIEGYAAPTRAVLIAQR